MGSCCPDYTASAAPHRHTGPGTTGGVDLTRPKQKRPVVERDQRLGGDGQAVVAAPTPATSSRSVTTSRRLMRPATMSMA